MNSTVPCSYSGSSFGWDAPGKRKELYHPMSRFILVREGGERVPVVAYVMFRFEREASKNVVYW